MSLKEQVLTCSSKFGLVRLIERFFINNSTWRSKLSHTTHFMGEITKNTEGTCQIEETDLLNENAMRNV